MNAIGETLALDWGHGELCLRLITAVVAAGVVGWERERQDKPAGLRTHMMVSLGSAAFMVMVLHLIASTDAQAKVSLDPLRVLQGIVGGVGFLGAGCIIRSRGSVEGITTASSVWVSAAIGSAAGLGFYWIVIMTAVLSLSILGVMNVLKHLLEK